MLVLGVRAGEYIQIGKNIKICVTKGRNERLRLGIEAPRDLEVLRGEVIDKLQQEEKAL